jgi:hypothetical protein
VRAALGDADFEVAFGRSAGLDLDAEAYQG